MSSALDAAAEALLAPWAGPRGGLPPLDRATPDAIEAAYHRALELRREEIRAIASQAAPPSFANTIEALEDSGRALQRVHSVFRVFSASRATGDMPAVAQRLAPLMPMQDDEIAHDEALFARVDAVWRSRAALDAEQRRLLQVVRDRFLRNGAGLGSPDKARLRDINSQLATLAAKYNHNLLVEQDSLTIFLEHEADLAGLSPALCDALAATASARGRPGIWAVPCLRPQVWPFLIQSTRRDLREKVWRLWNERGDHDGEHDNKPVANEILRLRGAKARLLGFPSYAHLATADRMAGTPQAALEVLQRTWRDVYATTCAQLDEFAALARDAGERCELAPWDRLHYAEKLRQSRFGLDMEAIRPYLPLESMLQAMFWCAGRLHGLVFTELHDVPVVDPGVRVYAVDRQVADRTEPVGTLYFDLFYRAGKMHGSYQDEYRAAESFRGKVLPISAIVSTFPAPAAGEPALLPWEYANVFFHEFGHALHILSNAAPYPSLGSLGVAWDFIEFPALINERWLAHPEVLQRYARHHRSGETIPPALLASLLRALKYDRIFALNLDYLAPAIVDLQMHLLADGEPGRVLDAVEIERQVMAELRMPAAWDQVMRVTHNFHCFVGSYAAGLYSYLWADVMAADAIEAFLQSPGGLFDDDTAQRWRRTILSAGNTVPADEAFRNFRGRGPDPGALLRRFDLAPASSA